MNIKILLLLCLFTSIIYSQNLSTYEGKFKYGNAKYTYYENNNFKRIYHGAFDYLRTNANFTMSVSGKFKENKQDGKWEYRKKNKHSSYSMIISGNYNNGMKNGVWIFNEISEPDYQTKEVKQSISQIEFKNDTLVNKIEFHNLIGQLKSNGEYTDKWILIDHDHEYIAFFNDNLLTGFLNRKISTGDVIAKYMPKKDSENMDDFYSDYTENLSKIYGLSNEYYEKEAQTKSIDFFFWKISKIINPFDVDDFVFLNNSELKLPRFIFKKDKSKEIDLEKLQKEYDETFKLDYSKAKGNDYKQECPEKGVVAVRIEVDVKGNVILAIPGVEGTTNKHPCLLEVAKKSALSTKFEPNNNAYPKRYGELKYTYTID